VKKGVADTRAAFPDSREDVLDVVAEGDMVMTRFVSSGTQKGVIAEIPGMNPPRPLTGSFSDFQNWQCIAL
jgi:predicted ester cyclase